MRRLAAYALSDPLSLRDAVHAAITFNSDPVNEKEEEYARLRARLRFRTDHQQISIDNLLNVLKKSPAVVALPLAQDTQPTSDKQKASIQGITDDLLQALANELLGSSLPNQQGPLVVVTQIKSLKDLRNAGVWRGLAQSADGVPSEDEEKKRNMEGLAALAVAATLVASMVKGIKGRFHPVVAAALILALGMALVLGLIKLMGSQPHTH